jgi:hypothetical protein
MNPSFGGATASPCSAESGRSAAADVPSHAGIPAAWARFRRESASASSTASSSSWSSGADAPSISASAASPENAESARSSSVRASRTSAAASNPATCAARIVTRTPVQLRAEQRCDRGHAERAVDLDVDHEVAEEVHLREHIVVGKPSAQYAARGYSAVGRGLERESDSSAESKCEVDMVDVDRACPRIVATRSRPRKKFVAWLRSIPPQHHGNGRGE